MNVSFFKRKSGKILLNHPYQRKTIKPLLFKFKKHKNGRVISHLIRPISEFDCNKTHKNVFLIYTLKKNNLK